MAIIDKIIGYIAAAIKLLGTNPVILNRVVGILLIFLILGFSILLFAIYSLPQLILAPY